MTDRDYEAEWNELNDRIALTTPCLSWKSRGDLFHRDQLPHWQVSVVDKILALSGATSIPYVTGTVDGEHNGVIVVVAGQLIIRADLTSSDGRSVDNSVTAVGRTSISKVELLEVAHPTTKAEWPNGVRVKISLPDGDLT